MEAGYEFGRGENLVLIGVADEAALLETERFLLNKGVRHCTFFEPDNAMGHTAITTEPLDKEKKKLLSNYSLWKY